MNLLSGRDMRNIFLRSPAGIVYLCQWCSLEEELDWEAVWVACCGNMYVTWKKDNFLTSKEL